MPRVCQQSHRENSLLFESVIVKFGSKRLISELKEKKRRPVYCSIESLKRGNEKLLPLRSECAGVCGIRFLEVPVAVFTACMCALDACLVELDRVRWKIWVWFEFPLCLSSFINK